jgi:energy-coupling factor transporter ATP-binding protein EcfA2
MSNRLLNVEQTARVLKHADRVLVIGCSGSGKSTLAQALSSLFALPYISMDRDVFWMPGWTQRPRAEALEIVVRAVAQPRWIMDGTSPGTLPLRLPRTDLVLWHLAAACRHVSLRPRRHMASSAGGCGFAAGRVRRWPRTARSA